MHVYISMCIYNIWMYVVCMHNACVCMSIYEYICIYVCMYVCIHAYMYSCMSEGFLLHPSSLALSHTTLNPYLHPVFLPHSFTTPTTKPILHNSTLSTLNHYLHTPSFPFLNWTNPSPAPPGKSLVPIPPLLPNCHLWLCILHYLSSPMPPLPSTLTLYLNPIHTVSPSKPNSQPQTSMLPPNPSTIISLLHSKFLFPHCPLHSTPCLLPSITLIPYPVKPLPLYICMHVHVYVPWSLLICIAFYLFNCQ